VDMIQSGGYKMCQPVYQTVWCHIPEHHKYNTQCHELLSTHTINNTSQVSCFCIVCISSEVVMRPCGEFCKSLDTWTTWRCQKNTYDCCKCMISLCWHCETGHTPYVQNCMYSEHYMYILFSLLVSYVFMIATGFSHVCAF